MQLKVFPNGTVEGAGTHGSMFVLIVPGKFDDLNFLRGHSVG